MEIPLNQNAVTRTFLERHMPNAGVTFVACYGIEKKPNEFQNYSGFLAKQLNCLLGRWIEVGWIKLTPKEQIHITGIGLEGVKDSYKIENTNLAERIRKAQPGGAVPPVDIEGLVEFLRELP